MSKKEEARETPAQVGGENQSPSEKDAIEDVKPLHDQLREDQLAKLRFVWDNLGPKLAAAATFEKLELEFRCNMNPDRKIVTWVAMTKAFLDFTKRHSKADKDTVMAHLRRLSKGRPISRIHADDLEQLYAEHYQKEKEKLYAEFGEEARDLLDDQKR